MKYFSLIPDTFTRLLGGKRQSLMDKLFYKN